MSRAMPRTARCCSTELPKAGFERFAPADGAFYLYADVAHLTNDSRDFCRRMLREIGVAATPGIDFDPARGHEHAASLLRRRGRDHRRSGAPPQELAALERAQRAATSRGAGLAGGPVHFVRPAARRIAYGARRARHRPVLRGRRADRSTGTARCFGMVGDRHARRIVPGSAGGAGGAAKASATSPAASSCSRLAAAPARSSRSRAARGRAAASSASGSPTRAAAARSERRLRPGAAARRAGGGVRRAGRGGGGGARPSSASPCRPRRLRLLVRRRALVVRADRDRVFGLGRLPRPAPRGARPGAARRLVALVA